MAGDLLSAAITLGLALLIALRVEQLWLIYLAVLLLASVDPLYQPAFRAALPSLVPVERLPRANAWIHIGEHAVNMAGPVAAAVVARSPLRGVTSATVVDVPLRSGAALSGRPAECPPPDRG